MFLKSRVEHCVSNHQYERKHGRIINRNSRCIYDFDMHLHSIIRTSTNDS
jgi:hypothetical protein